MLLLSQGNTTAGGPRISFPLQYETTQPMCPRNSGQVSLSLSYYSKSPAGLQEEQQPQSCADGVKEKKGCRALVDLAQIPGAHMAVRACTA